MGVAVNEAAIAEKAGMHIVPLHCGNLLYLIIARGSGQPYEWWIEKAPNLWQNRFTGGPMP
jgi:hypothetical protein